MIVFVLIACLTPWYDYRGTSDCRVVSVHENDLTPRIRAFELCDGDTGCQSHYHVVAEKVEP